MVHLEWLKLTDKSISSIYLCQSLTFLSLSFVAETCWTWTLSLSQIQVTAAMFTFILLIKFNCHVCNLGFEVISHPRFPFLTVQHITQTECVQFHTEIIKTLLHAPYQCAASSEPVFPTVHRDKIQQHSKWKAASPGSTGKDFQSSLLPIRATNPWCLTDRKWLMATQWHTQTHRICICVYVCAWATLRSSSEWWTTELLWSVQPLELLGRIDQRQKERERTRDPEKRKRNDKGW